MVDRDVFLMTGFDEYYLGKVSAVSDYSDEEREAMLSELLRVISSIVWQIECDDNYNDSTATLTIELR